MITRCFGCMEEYDDSYGLCPHCGYEPDTSVESPIHMAPGTVLHGRYLIGKVLGFGGFGVTYVGWDFTLRQKVAVKEYLPSELATRVIGQSQVSVFGGKKESQFDDGMEQFIEEARRLARFQNVDSIVRIFDSFAENNTAYIVMEYLEGETLTAYLDRTGKINPDEAIEMMTPVLKALDTIHQEGIIHRDIAPDNIMLTTDGQVKLIDFGAARHATTSHSRSLTVIIKPGYSPEEQYRSRSDQGPHTDVYALSAVLYRMITGIVPPDSMERRAHFEQNGKSILEPISKHCKISKSQENAIMNALNVQVQDRTATAAQFLSELTSAKPVRRIMGRIKIVDLMRWPLWAKILVPVAGIVVIALLALLLTGTIGPKGNLMTDVQLSETEARVPSIVNFSVDVADNRLDDYNLGCRIIGAEFSDVIPANTVIYQSEVAGKVIAKDSIVDVYVSTNQASSGASEGFMPYVVYKTEADARALLGNTKLNIKIEKVYDDIVAEGLVVSQNLAVGSDIKNGGDLTLEVSQGVDPNKPVPSETVVVLSRSKYSLYVGDRVTLRAKGGDGSYSYSSSDEAVVTVSRSGELIAKGSGTATITAASADAESASCTVTIQDYAMSLNPSELPMFAEGTANLSVAGIPSNAEVTWSSSDPNVATVSESGKVTGIATGTATITATWKTEVKTYTATAEVTVEAYGITLNVYKIGKFYVGETKTLKATTSPADQKVTWSSSNEKVAKVDQNGNVTAVGGGTAVITAGFDEYSESCTVVITQPGLSITKGSVSLLIGDSATISASVTPSGVDVVWSTEDSSIAKVENGKITAVGAGTTRIRAKMSYAGISYSASCTVTVSKPGIKLSQASLGLMPGGSSTLKATTTPNGLSVTWSSSDSSVATVSNGTVKAVGNGTCTIRAKITYKGKDYSASCTVEVAKPTMTISSTSNTLEFSPKEKGSCTVTAKVTPDGGKISWSSSNTSVATVSGSGTSVTVTGVGEGTATIKATYTVSGTTVTDSCTITVQKAGSTLNLANISYPSSGTCDSFRIQGTVSSNYPILRLECSGSCTSNALGITLNDTADPLNLPENTFSYDLSSATAYFINQYKKLYKLYEGAAGLLGADDSVTMKITGTAVDASGKTVSFRCTYVIHGG